MESGSATAIASKVRTTTIEKAVNSLFKWKESQYQKPQLLPQDDFIYLNLTLKKIPPKPRTNAFRIPFPHPLHDRDNSQLCLIIDDRRNSKLASDAAKKIIDSDKIPVAKVIKLSKLKTDYKPFEAKRKLCNSYDLFLSDRRIVHLLPKLLGKMFFKKKKLPLPLDLTHKNWKEQVERACGSGLLTMRTGTCCVMKVGKGSMKIGQIVENVVEAIAGVVQVVPKGWDGIRSLHLRLANSLALPLYQTLPDIKLKIEGFKEEEEQAEAEGEVRGSLVEVKESSGEKAEVSGKKKSKGRIHEVRYMDFDTGVDELGTDVDGDVGNITENAGNDAEEGIAGEDNEESEDDGVDKLKKRKAVKDGVLSKLNGAKKSKKDEKRKKSAPKLLGKKLKDSSVKAKSKRSKIRA